MITEITGEPVETILKPIWPAENLPDLLDGWVRKYEPDLVLLVISGYWMTFESVPLRLEHRLGRLGKWLGRLGEKSVARGPVAKAGPVVNLRQLARRIIGAEANFTPKQVNEIDGGLHSCAASA